MGRYLAAGDGIEPSSRASKARSRACATRHLAPDQSIELRSTRFRASRAHLGDPVSGALCLGSNGRPPEYKTGALPLRQQSFGVTCGYRSRPNWFHKPAHSPACPRHHRNRRPACAGGDLHPCTLTLEFRPGIAPGNICFAGRGIRLPPRGTNWQGYDELNAI